MEIFFNELSILPKSKTNIEANDNIITLLSTLKELRKYDYRVMRVHENFYAEELCDGYTFVNFINDISVNRDLKILLQSLVKSPFLIKDSEEEEIYVINTFKTENHLNEYVESEGIASAYIYNEPTISIQSCNFWKRTLIDMSILPSGGEAYNVSVMNFWNEKSVIDWASTLLEENIPLNSIENIKRVFPEDQFKFDQQAIDDLIGWYYDDNRYQEKIKSLILDTLLHPFVGGLGLTEVLKNENGKASKKIVKKDRIKYTYTRELITIHQCKGHYGDK